MPLRVINEKRFRGPLWRSVLVPVATLTCATFFLSWAVGRLLFESSKVQHSDQVIARANEWLKLAVDMETGVRGFQLTGDPTLLEPYENASRTISPTYFDLQSLVADNPEQLDRARAAFAAQRDWSAFARDLIRRRQEGRDYQSVEVNTQGKALFDAFRQRAGVLVAAEEQLKSIRARSFARSLRISLRGRWAFLACLCTGIGWYAWRQMGAAGEIFLQSQERAQQEAEKARQRGIEFEAIFEHALVGVAQVDASTGHFLRCNPTFCRLVGYSAEELVGQYTPEDLTHPENRAEDRLKLQRMFRGEIEHYAAEKRYVRRDGEVIWADVIASMIRDVKGRPLRTVEVIVDLTARRKAEHALRVSEDRLRLATEAAEVGIWDWDIVSGELYWSEKCKIMFGFSPQHRVSYEDFISSVAPEDRERVKSAVNAAVNGNNEGLYSIEFRSRWKDGTVRWINSRGSVRFGENDRRPVRFFGSALDITELKQNEAKLRAAHDELEEKVRERTRDLSVALEKAQEVDRLKSEFLATMSHELRTPLNSVIGFAEILAAGLPGPVNEEQKRQLSFVHGSANHLLQMINDLLDLARIESGRVQPFFENFNPADVIHDALETIRPLAQKKGLRLATDLDLPAHIKTDRKMFFQVLLNLLSNAVKFTSTGEITLTSRLEDSGLLTRVRDTGIGIKPEQFTLLFEAFRQVDGSVHRRYEGTGLGLYLCRKILNLLGGHIQGESEYGRGSVFSFWLPMEGPL